MSNLLLPYCIACGRKHSAGPCANATADLSRYQEVPLDTPSVKVVVSGPILPPLAQMTRKELIAAYPRSAKPGNPCAKKQPEAGHGNVCSRDRGHEGAHAAYYGSPESFILAWNDGDSKSVAPAKL